VFVYRVTNLRNGKVYIGKWQGERVADRWLRHLADVNRGSSYYFHNAIRKYGAEAFKVEIVDHADTTLDLVDKERFHILLHQSFKPEIGYNQTMGGEGVLGFRHTLETRSKTSKTLKGHEVSVETRRRMSVADKGREISLKARKKISLALKGRPLSIKNREGIRAAWTPERRAAQAERGRILGKGNRCAA
jgi:group I intron endonuclease